MLDRTRTCLSVVDNTDALRESSDEAMVDEADNGDLSKVIIFFQQKYVTKASEDGDPNASSFYGEFSKTEGFRQFMKRYIEELFSYPLVLFFNWEKRWHN